MKTLLIADDNQATRYLFREAMTSEEYRLLIAEDGNAAWTMIEQYRPMVVVLDIEMPGLSGIELTRKIKSDPSLKKTRVLLLTSHSSGSEIHAGMRAGANGYLIKPYPMGDLRKIVRAELGLR